MNTDILAPQVRLIGAEGEQLGIVSRADALARAESAGLDLAEIAPNATPPVAKILDWGKYRYEQTKLLAKNKKKQKLTAVKQVRVGLKTGEHDILVKQTLARRFLAEGNKVKVSLRFRGREITHQDLGAGVLKKFTEGVADVAEIEQQPALTGKELSLVLTQKHNAKTQNPPGNEQANKVDEQGKDAAPQGVS